MGKQLQVLRAWVSDNVFAVVWAIFFIIAFYFLYLHNLLSVPATSLEKSTTALISNGFSWESLFLPYNIVVWVFHSATNNDLLSARLASVMFATLGLIGFYLIIRKWYTKRLVIMTIAMLMSSSWLVFSARLAGPHAVYLILPLVVASLMHLVDNKHKSQFNFLIIAVLAVLCLYIPGTVWLVVPTLYILRNQLIKAFSNQKLLLKVASITVVIAGTFPLFLCLLSGSSLFSNITQIAGLPQHASMPLTYLVNMTDLIGRLFVYSHSLHQGLMIGHQPILDIATSTFVFIGLWQYIINFKLKRSKLVILGLLLAILLVSLGGAVSDTMLIPFIYIQAAEGIRWLLNKWLAVFPKNPIARGIGVGIMAILIITIAIFHIVKYQNAWVKGALTQQTGHSTELSNKP